jgi:branched-subunit amino acid transport protein
MPKKSKAQKWFIPVRGSYLPNNWKGWLSYIPFSAYLIFAVVFGWRDTETTAQAVLFIVPNWVAATAVMTWLARRTS